MTFFSDKTLIFGIERTHMVVVDCEWHWIFGTESAKYTCSSIFNIFHRVLMKSDPWSIWSIWNLFNIYGYVSTWAKNHGYTPSNSPSKLSGIIRWWTNGFRGTKFFPGPPLQWRQRDDRRANLQAIFYPVPQSENNVAPQKKSSYMVNSEDLNTKKWDQHYTIEVFNWFLGVGITNSSWTSPKHPSLANQSPSRPRPATLRLGQPHFCTTRQGSSPPSEWQNMGYYGMVPSMGWSPNDDYSYADGCSPSGWSGHIHSFTPFFFGWIEPTPNWWHVTTLKHDHSISRSERWHFGRLDQNWCIVLRQNGPEE